MRGYFFRFRNTRASFHSCPENCRGPRQEGHEQHRNVKPERLDVLEFGSEVAFEIVLDDEDGEEVGIASGAADIPGKSGEGEGPGRGGMKEAAGGRSELGEKRLDKIRDAGRRDRGSTIMMHEQGRE